MKNRPPNGFITLITVIIIGGVGIIVASFLLLTGLSTSKTSFSAVQSAQAQGAANGCTELALALLQSNINLATPASANATLDSSTKAQCSYTITGTSPNYTIAALGTVDSGGVNVTRRLTVTLNQVAPVLNISSWQETP